jgi:hypothetical protein
MSLINDVRLSLKKLEQDRPALKKFGLVMAAALAVLGILVYIFGSHPQRSFILWGVGALFCFSAVFIPNSLKMIHRYWMVLAFTLGWFMSRLILTILFFAIITPIGLIKRLFGSDSMHLKFDPEASTYWIKRQDKPFDPKNYERQF